MSECGLFWVGGDGWGIILGGWVGVGSSLFWVDGGGWENILGGWVWVGLSGGGWD